MFSVGGGAAEGRSWVLGAVSEKRVAGRDSSNEIFIRASKSTNLPVLGRRVIIEFLAMSGRGHGAGEGER